MTLLGIGNILQKDDGFGVYASTYIKENYRFSEPIEIINGGVEGINLYSIVEESASLLILDILDIKETPSTIYAIPAKALSGYGLNSGGAHEIGILNCLEMLELQGKEVPKATVLGIVPLEIRFDIDLTSLLKEAFDGYIQVVLNFLKKEGIDHSQREKIVTLEEIIREVRRI